MCPVHCRFALPNSICRINFKLFKWYLMFHEWLSIQIQTYTFTSNYAIFAMFIVATIKWKKKNGNENEGNNKKDHVLFHSQFSQWPLHGLQLGYHKIRAQCKQMSNQRSSKRLPLQRLCSVWARKKAPPEILLWVTYASATHLSLFCNARLPFLHYKHSRLRSFSFYEPWSIYLSVMQTNTTIEMYTYGSSASYSLHLMINWLLLLLLFFFQYLFLCAQRKTHRYCTMCSSDMILYLCLFQNINTIYMIFFFCWIRCWKLQSHLFISSQAATKSDRNVILWFTLIV